MVLVEVLVELHACIGEGTLCSSACLLGSLELPLQIAGHLLANKVRGHVAILAVAVEDAEEDVALRSEVGQREVRVLVCFLRRVGIEAALREARVPQDEALRLVEQRCLCC
jgi:hypothetical protein